MTGEMGMARPAVQIEFTKTARVTVAGRHFQLERTGSGIWFSGDFFRESVNAAVLEDAVAVLFHVADQLRDQGAVGEELPG
jgi:hypothetical protein